MTRPRGKHSPSERVLRALRQRPQVRTELGACLGKEPNGLPLLYLMSKGLVSSEGPMTYRRYRLTAEGIKRVQRWEERERRELIAEIEAVRA